MYKRQGFDGAPCFPRPFGVDFLTVDDLVASDAVIILLAELQMCVIFVPQLAIGAIDRLIAAASLLGALDLKSVKILRLQSAVGAEPLDAHRIIPCLLYTSRCV